MRISDWSSDVCSSDLLGVAINERHAATRVVEYLLELGHRRIGFVMGDPGHGASMARYQGYCDGLQRAGIAIESDLVVRGYFNFDSGRAAGEHFVQMRAMHTAVFDSNDEKTGREAWREQGCQYGEK